MLLFKRLVCAAAAAIMALGSGAPAEAQSLNEGFENVGALAGWSMINRSSPLGTTDWFQGDAGIFPAFAGTPNSYIAANFNNTGGTGTISNWLITPTLVFNNGATVSFYTRTDFADFPDRLEVRFSNVGGANVGTTATSVGTFGTLLGSINPNLNVGGYPEVWTQYSFSISGLSGPTNGSIAFRYFVTDGGVFGDNSNFIGIDSVAITPSVGPAIPEPGTWLTIFLGFGMLGSLLRRRRRDGALVRGAFAVA